MKRTYLLVTLFFALFIGKALNNTAFAQESETTKKANSFDPYWYVNLNAGRSLLYGDLMTTPLNLDKFRKANRIYWRHKVLSELTTSASTKMEDLVVCDVKKMSKSQKDDIYLNRPP